MRLFSRRNTAIPWNGSGVFARNQDFGADRDAGVPDTYIQADLVDDEFDNAKTGLEHCQTVNGETTITANLPMNAFRHTGVGNAVARTDYAAAGQIQNQGLIFCVVGGTGDVITLTPTPAITVYAAGQKFCWVATAANTTAVTVNVSAVGAKNLRKGSGSTALIANDIIIGQYCEAAYDGTQLQLSTPIGGQATTYQPIDATLTSLAALGTGAGKYAYTTGVDTWAEDTITAAGRALIDDAAASNQRTTLGLGSIATLGIASLSGLLWGCTLANNAGDATNDIDFTAGSCMDSTNAFLITVAAMTKELDVNWAVGTNTGMRNSGAAITNTTYHIYVVAKADGTQDFYAHTSTTVATVITALQAESGGSAYIYARRIGSIVRTGGAIKAFVQSGDLFRWKVQVVDQSGTPGTTSAVLVSLSVPTGLLIEAITTVEAGVGVSTAYVLVTSPDETDTTPTSSMWSMFVTTGIGLAMTEKRVKTDSSGRIRYRSDQTDVSVAMFTMGYVDTRGRLA